MALQWHSWALLLTGVLSPHTHTHTPIVKTVEAVAGTLSISGTDTSITGDVTAARLLDQANTDYFIDPAGSGTSLVTAGKVAIATTSATENFTVAGNIGFTGGGKIKDNAGSLQLQAGGTGTGSTGTGSIYFLDSSGGTAGRFDSTAGSGTWPAGDGADGAITVSVDKNINTDTLASGRSCADGGDAVNYSVTASVAAAATSVTLSSTPSSGCLAAGDEVLIINLQGTTGDNANVGKYETKEISAVSGATLTVKALTNAYDGTTQKIMVQRIPNYTSVTVNTGITLTASAWDGTKGGVLFFRASGTVTVTGTISMASKGFRGGTTSLTPENGTGRPAGAGGGNGGNGGPRSDNNTPPPDGTNGENGAGGGGGGSTALGQADCPQGGSVGGGQGHEYYNYSGNCSTPGSGTAGTGGGGGAGDWQGGGGGGAKPYNSLTNSTPTSFATALLGGGGANGGGSGNGSTGGSKAGTGGNNGTAGNPGGGIIIIKAATLNNSGSITAAGGVGAAGGNASNGTGGAGGGWGANGAAGGSILLHAPTINLSASTVTATGGSGGSGGTGGTGSGAGGSGGAGSTGGAGQIRIVYTTNNGSLTHSPTPTTSTTLDTNTPYGAFYLSTTNTSSQDLAEYYVSGDSSVAAGDVVTLSTSEESKPTSEVNGKGVLRKAQKPYDPKLIGIISTNPGVLMGSIDGEGKEDKRMLALSGRVPVKIDPDSAAFDAGDFLTSSSKPGLATKAMRPGYVVARALESWQPGGADRIEAFLQLTYYMGDIDPWGNFKTLEVDALKVNKTLEVDGINIMDEINNLKQRLDAIEAR